MSDDTQPAPGESNTTELVTFNLPNAGRVLVTLAEAEQLRIGVKLMARWRETLRVLARN